MGGIEIVGSNSSEDEQEEEEEGSKTGGSNGVKERPIKEGKLEENFRPVSLRGQYLKGSKPVISIGVPLGGGGGATKG